MKLKERCSLWWLLVPILLLDRIGKRLAMAYLAGGRTVCAIKGLLSWAYVENRGVAFGMAQGGGWLLILLAALLTAALLAWLLLHRDDSPLLRTGLWMIVGGGLGNLYDRIFYGFVVDFIRLDFIDFPLFNPADVFVCVGAALTALAVLTQEGKKDHGAKADFSN